MLRWPVAAALGCSVLPDRVATPRTDAHAVTWRRPSKTDLSGECQADANRPFASSQDGLLMNKPSQRRKVSSAPLPCGSKAAFTSGVTCASIERSNACIVSS